MRRPWIDQNLFDSLVEAYHDKDTALLGRRHSPPATRFLFPYFFWKGHRREEVEDEKLYGWKFAYTAYAAGMAVAARELLEEKT